MLSFFEKEETKKLRSHIANLGALAKIDGHVDPTEMNYIISIGKKHGMKPDEVRNLVSNTSKNTPHLPANDSERFDQIYDLVEMMLADGIVDESEMEFCINMATKLGFKKDVVGTLVQKISIGVKDGLARELIKQDAEAYFAN